MFPVYRMASQRRDLVRRSGNRRRASVAVGESQKSSRQAKADAEGGQRGASERQRRMAKADAVGVRTRRATGEILCAEGPIADLSCGYSCSLVSLRG